MIENTPVKQSQASSPDRILKKASNLNKTTLIDLYFFVYNTTFDFIFLMIIFMA
jgi:hypothetical protein